MREKIQMDEKECHCCLRKSKSSNSIHKHIWTGFWLGIVIVSGFGGFMLSQKWSKTESFMEKHVWKTPIIRKEFFTGSPVELLIVAEDEEDIYSVLKTWLTQLLEARSQQKHRKKNDDGLSEEHLDLVQKYVEDYQDSTNQLLIKEGESRANLVADNPLAVFRMIRRFVKFLTPLKDDNNNSYKFPVKAYHDNVKRIEQNVGWPTATDLEDTIKRIHRLQQVYDLKTSDLAVGEIGPISTKIQLSPEQCYEFGMEAYNKSIFTFSIEWLEMAAQKLKTQNPSSKFLDVIQSSLYEAIERHNSTWNTSISDKTQYHFSEPIQPYSIFDVDVKVPKTARISVRTMLMQKYRGVREDYSITSYWAFCSGESYQTEKEKLKLFCWLEFTAHPYLRIAPMKMELLSLEPDIVQIYNFVGEQMMEKIKKKAATGLKYSHVSDTTNHSNTLRSEIRTSTQTWITDLNDKELLPLSHKIAIITGLRTDIWAAVEQLQVLAYAFGGHYMLHRDALLHEERYGINGDRIATFMMYLSDVTLGGYTAFSHGGIGAKPIKGSAVLWYNLYSEGIEDRISQHGGCPVIIGSKWAATKWIRYREQFRQRPCALKQQEILRLPYKTYKSKLQEFENRIEIANSVIS